MMPEESEQPKPSSEVEEAKAQPEQKKPKQKIPDWKPLGAVRDSFYEQIKQDERR